MINIKTKDGNCDTYVAFPKEQKNLPIVLLYMDAIGLRPRMYEMADHLSEQGYFVVMPNLFYREKKSPVVDYDTYLAPSRLPELFQQVMPMAMKLTPELSRNDTEAWLQYATSQPQVNPNKIGAVGYCMGGGQALRTAGNFPEQIKAAASFHAGNLCTDAETSPHRWLSKIKGEVYIGHADNDQHMQPEQQQKFEMALKEAHLKYQAELYKDCPHGWTMADLPAYRKEGEQKHWRDLFALFERTLRNN